VATVKGTTTLPVPLVSVRLKCSVVPQGSDGSSVTCSGVVLAALASPAMSG